MKYAAREVAKRYRWMCPTCKMKNTCCEGEPVCAKS